MSVPPSSDEYIIQDPLVLQYSWLLNTEVALTLHPEEYLGVPDLEFNVDPLEFDNGLSEKDVRKFGGGSALENPSSGDCHA